MLLIKIILVVFSFSVNSYIVPFFYNRLQCGDIVEQRSTLQLLINYGFSTGSYYTFPIYTLYDYYEITM